MSFLRRFSEKNIHGIFEMVDPSKDLLFLIHSDRFMRSLSCVHCYSKIEKCLGLERLESITRIVRLQPLCHR